MARTKQAMMSRNQPMLHSTQADDHHECLIVRTRFGMPNETVPYEGFQKENIFAFQVYFTIGLDIYDEDMDMSEKVNVPYGGLTLNRLVEYLASNIAANSSCPAPVFEFYTGCPDDVLACVAHQKHEIAHRKAARDNSETLLIPRVAHGEGADADESGFIIVIASENYKKGSAPSSENDEGPLFVYFDRGRGNDVRIERTPSPEVARLALANLYRASYPRMDFALDIPEFSPPPAPPL